MRTHGNLVKMALLALLLVALAACGAAQPGAENVEIADSAGTGTVTGTVTYLDPVSYTHLRAHETVLDLVCRLLLEKKKQHNTNSY